MKPITAVTDRGVLIICMAISFMLWLGNTLSETHISRRLPIELEYVHLPTDLVPVQVLPERVFIGIEANGVDMLRYNWRKNQLILNYDDYRNSTKISTDKFQLLLNEQFPNTKILDISPDTILFSFQKKYTKKVPIQMTADISPATRFTIQTVAIRPDSLEISGIKSAIDTIQTWKTQTLSARDLTENLVGKLPLENSAISTIQTNIQEVDYEVLVEEYTEKRLEHIPITIQNLPAPKSVFLYPSQVSLQFQVPVSKFDDINANNFQIVADFKDINWKMDKTVPFHAINNPPYIKSLKIIPRSYAEFILMK